MGKVLDLCGCKDDPDADEIKEGDANPDADDEDKELFVLLEFIILLLGRVWRRMFWYGRFF